MTAVITLSSGRTINRRQLERLRMLADWQVRQEGFDPIDITMACLRLEEQQE